MATMSGSSVTYRNIQSLDEVPPNRLLGEAVDLSRLAPSVEAAFREAISIRLSRWGSPFDRVGCWKSVDDRVVRNRLMNMKDHLPNLRGAIGADLENEIEVMLNGYKGEWMSVLVPERTEMASLVMVSERLFGRGVDPSSIRRREVAEAKQWSHPARIIPEYSFITHEDLHPTVNFALSLQGFLPTVLNDLSSLAGFDLSRARTDDVAQFFAREVSGYAGARTSNNPVQTFNEAFAEAAMEYLHCLAIGETPRPACQIVGIALDRSVGHEAVSKHPELRAAHFKVAQQFASDPWPFFKDSTKLAIGLVSTSGWVERQYDNESYGAEAVRTFGSLVSRPALWAPAIQATSSLSSTELFSQADLDLVRPIKSAHFKGNRLGYVKLLEAFNKALSASEVEDQKPSAKSKVSQLFSGAVQQAASTLAFDLALVEASDGQLTYAGVNKEISTVLTGIVRIPQVQERILGLRRALRDGHQISLDSQQRWPRPFEIIGNLIATDRPREASGMVRTITSGRRTAMRVIADLRSEFAPFLDAGSLPGRDVSYDNEGPLLAAHLKTSGGATEWNSLETATKVAELAGVTSRVNIPDTVAVVLSQTQVASR